MSWHWPQSIKLTGHGSRVWKLSAKQQPVKLTWYRKRQCLFTGNIWMGSTSSGGSHGAGGGVCCRTTPVVTPPWKCITTWIPLSFDPSYTWKHRDLLSCLRPPPPAHSLSAAASYLILQGELRELEMAGKSFPVSWVSRFEIKVRSLAGVN